MTARQLQDLLAEHPPGTAIVVATGDGYAPVEGLRACGPFCLCLTSRGTPDIRYDDDALPRIVQRPTSAHRDNPLKGIDTSLNSDVGD